MANKSVEPKKLLKGVPEAILFDLDGTLVDSAPDLTHALNNTLEALALSLVTLEEVKTWIGNGIDHLLHRALTKTDDTLASEGLFLPARTRFYREYEKQSGQLSKLYPGVAELLAELKHRRIQAACITNKSRCFTLPLLKKLAIDQYFSSVVCGDDLSNKKPHPEPLLYTANKLAVPVSQCLMVGDSAADVGAANAASMAMICVNYGYNQGVDLASLEINGMISQMKELIALVGGLSSIKTGEQHV